MSGDVRQSEEWRPVVGYEGVYEVSSRGRVKSLARRIWVSPGKRCAGFWRNRNERLLTLVDKDGYPFVDLSRGAKSVMTPVHFLVLNAFVGPRPERAVARHKNGRRDDNRVENLVWGTHLENMADKHLHGTAPVGERNPAAKLTAEQARLIRGAPQREVPSLCRTFNIAAQTACDIRKRHSWESIEDHA